MTGAFWWSVLVGLYLLSALRHDPRLLLFALMLSFASGASTLWARYSLAELSYRRRFGRPAIPHGEQTDLTIEIYNAKPLPLPWVLASDQYPDGLTLASGHLGTVQSGGFRRSLVNFLALRSYERVRRVYRVLGENRGVFRLGPAELSAGDVFGFRRQHTIIEEQDILVVYPKVVPLEALGLPAARPHGDFLSRRRVIEDPLRYSGVREYAPGDSIRHIHWKATARTLRLQTRTFDPSASHHLYLLLDVQTSTRPYVFVPEHLELLVSAAASVALHALEQGYSVGVTANSQSILSESTLRVPPGRHPDQATQILHALAHVTGFRIVPFSRLLSVLGPDLPFGATLVALTSQPDEEVQESLYRLEELGCRTVLLTVGEQKPDLPPPLESYHLGGAEAWHELEALEIA